jgi:nicotinate dehydrogenase subunit B
MRALWVKQRSDLFSARGVLLVLRPPLPQPAPVAGQPSFVASLASEGDECLLALWDDASVTALHGHVDLGTGLRTALAQLVSEELNMSVGKVHLLMGHTALSPNQGATIASTSLQIHGAPLRAAAAQARDWLCAKAAVHFQCEAQQLRLQDGQVFFKDLAISVQHLLADQQVLLQLDSQTPLKPAADFHTIGQSTPRVDMAAKVFGDLIYVHDMRMPGMLHGRVVRPPYAGADHGDFIGNTLAKVDRDSIAHIDGIRAVVVQGDFVGIVAEREEQAEQAMHDLVVQWKPWPGMPHVQDAADAIRHNTRTTRELVNEGDVDSALSEAAHLMQREYVWPYQMHASIGPSCAVAWWLQGSDAQSPQVQLRVWAGTQNPHVLRADLAMLCGVVDPAVDIVRMEAAGCYGRNGADDVAADAALLSKAVGAPVRVQLSREQEHAWEPKGAAQLMQVRGGLSANGQPAGYDFQTSYPSNGAPTLALLLTRTIEPTARAYEMGDRTARPPYDYADLRITVHDMPPLLRASWLRGVSALPNSFAHESFIDELAAAANADPLQYRLHLLSDPRAKELLQATADRAGWQVHSQPQQKPAHGDWLQGQGVAYARYVHSKWPGFGAAWSAWVADVEVHRNTGEVHVKRVVVGHDAGLVVNPKGVEQQVHGNVLQTTSRALLEKVETDAKDGRVVSQDWGSYPILNFRQVPVIEVVQMPRPGDDVPLGAGESSSVPGTAAIANAIFDATGIRFRNPPFTPEVVRAALHPLGAPAPAPAPMAETVTKPPKSTQPGLRQGWRKRWQQVTGVALGVFALSAAIVGWRVALPTVNFNPTNYSADMLQRGQQLAALGNCAGCHTAQDSMPNAGGRPMHTPFGTVFSTNLTPDVQTGIGAWSYQAFERAMRQGISRDGHALYPVFPFTSFAKTSDADMMALYAWLMSQPAVTSYTPEAQMQWGLGWRPLMALWNGLFHAPVQFQAQAQQSAEWNRGAYLVNGLGHCGACHTPRNALGAERNEQSYMQGAMVDGWQAPALTGLNPSPVPWSEEEFFRYLRQGHTQQHGIAAGPMGLVVRNLALVPDKDIRAMAVYLASLQPVSNTDEAQLETLAAKVVVDAARLAPLPDAAQRLFQGSCGACHHDGEGPQLLGVNRPLALNTNLHSDRPDNLLRIVLEGIQAPASKDIGFMPSFANTLSDKQLVMLVDGMRARYAPDKPPWQNTAQTLAAMRRP